MPIVKNDAGLEKVFVDNLEELGDLSARTGISDGTTSIFLHADANGRLNVNTFGGGPLKGNDGNDGGGTDRTVKCDGNGILFCKEVGTVNVAPANTLNSHITDDPSNSIAVGLTGRQTIGTATTQTHLKCDANGQLFVDNASFGHLNTIATQSTTTATQSTTTATNTGTIATNTGKITQGKDIVSDAGGLQQVLLYGKNGANGNLEPLETLTDRLVVKNLELGATGPTTTSSLSRIGIYGQVDATSNYKTVRINSDGRMENVLQSQTQSINQYASQSIAGSGTWTTTIDTTGYGKTSIVVNSNASSNLMVYGSATSGGTFLPFKEIFINSSDVGASNANIGYVELHSAPNFLKIVNVDAGGVVLEIITTSSN